LRNILRWLYYKIFSLSRQKSLALSIRMNVTLSEVSCDLIILSSMTYCLLLHIWRNLVFLLFCYAIMISYIEVIFFFFSKYSKQNSVVIYYFLTIILHFVFMFFLIYSGNIEKIYSKSSIMDKLENYLTHLYSK